MCALKFMNHKGHGPWYMKRSQLAATGSLSCVSMCPLLNCKALNQGVASGRLLDGNPSTIYSTERYKEHVKALLPFLQLSTNKQTALNELLGIRVARCLF